MESDPIVEVRNLTKVFDGFAAVDQISFCLYRGEIVGLLGPNGAGKTTTLQMLLGTLTPTAGSVKIFGLDINKNRQDILSRINFSSTYTSMPTALSIYENLRVFAALYGVRNYHEKIDEVMHLFDIYNLRNQLTETLSSGQMTRLSLAKTFLNNPAVLFLDEPTASLDPDIADRTRGILKMRRDRNGMTIFYTSHNMKEMEEMCDRIIFLNRGKIIAEGTPEEILRRYEEEHLEALFLKIAREGE
ncbi:MAG: ABC transporter ATP-binding protein [Nitrospirae bacterium]|nr:ABC transporter ATP-binding protein [Nitrospirota bacterium]